MSVDQKQRLRGKWLRAEFRLRRYAENCSAARFFDSREGWFVFTRTALLLVLLFWSLWAESICVWTFASLFAAYLLVDALLANTSAVFITGAPISTVRSVVLTMGTYLALALCFAVPWEWLVVESFGTLWDRAITSIYESLRTMTTAGPEHPPDRWAGKLLVIAELLVGIYFIAIIIANYASWARPDRPGGREK